MFTFLSTLSVWEYGIRCWESFQNKLVSSSFKWVPKYILFLAKLKWEGRPFWNGEKHSLILGRGGNVNYYKSVRHLILTQENREHPSNFENKPVALLSIYISRISFQGIFSSYPNWRGRGRPFLRGARRVTALWYYP